MRLGTRASALALAQAKLVLELLGVDWEVVPILTSGDRHVAGEDEHALSSQDKSRWVGELELALSSGNVDLAVHSAKDLPGELAEGLVLAGAPARAGAEDVLCGAAETIAALPSGARVGTSSVRRAAQLRAAREDLDLVPMRGNVDTRLAKLERGEYDAIVLARAGLQRLEREDAIAAVLDPAEFVPAPGQGTLALEVRADDAAAKEALAEAIDPDTFECLLAERALAAALDADCHTPLGAHATVSAGQMLMRAWVGLPDGSMWIADQHTGDAREPDTLARVLARRLELAGARELLANVVAK